MSLETLFRGKYLEFKRRNRWEFVSRVGCHGIVAMIPLTHEQELVLVEQRRLPLQRPVFEIPAGLVDQSSADGTESLEDAASRELIEETGFSPGRLTFLFEGPPSAGISDELISFFLATDLTRVGPGGGDASESITVHKIPLDQVKDWLKNRLDRGDLIDPKVFTGLYFINGDWKDGRME